MKKMSLPIILAVAAITATSYNCSDSKTDRKRGRGYGDDLEDRSMRSQEYVSMKYTLPFTFKLL